MRVIQTHPQARRGSRRGYQRCRESPQWQRERQRAALINETRRTVTRVEEVESSESRSSREHGAQVTVTTYGTYILHHCGDQFYRATYVFSYVIIIFHESGNLAHAHRYNWNIGQPIMSPRHRANSTRARPCFLKHWAASTDQALPGLTL